MVEDAWFEGINMLGPPGSPISLCSELSFKFQHQIALMQRTHRLADTTIGFLMSKNPGIPIPTSAPSFPVSNPSALFFHTQRMHHHLVPQPFHPLQTTQSPCPNIPPSPPIVSRTISETLFP
jgi:hypothetical protein